MEDVRDLIHKVIREKSVLKQDVFYNTIDTFKSLKKVLQSTIDDIQQHFGDTDSRVTFYYKDRGEFQAEIKIAGDILVFQMHTNVFQFDRGHSLWKSSYLKENEANSYVGIINVYNFLADSFKFNREGDIGYLIGRIFVNRENHFLVQGKRQLGFLYNDFINAVLDEHMLESVINSTIMYSLDFDMFTPPYENMQMVTVEMIQSLNHGNGGITGKRLGFQFGLDEAQG